jgi:5'-nucleotidase
MRFLLSNDDGVFAPGLLAMAEVLATLGEVTVVAPDIERSAFSSALTLDRPLRPQRLANGFIAVNGTPADCVHIALNGLLDFVPDVIVSGINAGANLGDDVIYSGTVAAALEGRFTGKSAMAVSLVASQAKSLGIDAYRPAAIRAGELLQQWSSLALPPRCMLNVNVPEGPLTSHKGFATTRLGHRNPSPPVLKLRDPRGQDVYWIGPSGEPSDDADGTDFHAIKEGFISVTALDSDMTCRRSSAMLGQWLAKVGAV